MWLQIKMTPQIIIFVSRKSFKMRTRPEIRAWHRALLKEGTLYTDDYIEAFLDGEGGIAFCALHFKPDDIFWTPRGTWSIVELKVPRSWAEVCGDTQPRPEKASSSARAAASAARLVQQAEGVGLSPRLLAQQAALLAAAQEASFQQRRFLLYICIVLHVYVNHGSNYSYISYPTAPS
jgi:hypothetical protein